MAEEPQAPPETPPEAAEANGQPEGDSRAWEVERRDLRAENATYRRRVKDAETQLEQLRREHETEQERVVRENAERVRAEVAAEYEQQIVELQRGRATDRIRVMAAGTFRDPEDAVRMLNVDGLLAEADLQKRDKLAAKALQDLLEAKPYLARQEERPAPSLLAQGMRSPPPGERPQSRSWLRPQPRN